MDVAGIVNAIPWSSILDRETKESAKSSNLKSLDISNADFVSFLFFGEGGEKEDSAGGDFINDTHCIMLISYNWHILRSYIVLNKLVTDVSGNLSDFSYALICEGKETNPHTYIKHK